MGLFVFTDQRDSLLCRIIASESVSVLSLLSTALIVFLFRYFYLHVYIHTPRDNDDQLEEVGSG